MRLKYLGPSGRITVHVTSEPITFDPEAEVPDSVAPILLKERTRHKKPLFEVVEKDEPKRKKETV